MFVSLTLVICLLLTVVRGNSRNDLIIDYFSYKKVSTVVGFSCSMLEDFSLMKRLNNIGVTGSINIVEDGSEVKHQAFTAYTKLGIFLDFRCYSREVTTFIFSNASDYRFYNELHYWLIIGSNLKDVMSTINDNAFTLSTDFTIATPSSNNLPEKYDLYDAYNPWKSRGVKLNVTFLGSWNASHKVSLLVEESKLNRRKNMNRVPLRTFFYWSKNRPSNMHLEDYYKVYTLYPIDGLDKYGYNILYHLSELYNFTLHVNMAPLWIQGDMVGPIMRAIFSDEIDISGTATTFTKLRYKYIKYIHQSFPFRTCFMFLTPQKKDIKMNEILGPFDYRVWYTIGFFFILCTAILSLIFRHESDDTISMRYSNSFLITIGSLCQQATDMKMTQLSTRAAFLWIMISSLLIYNYYSAVVVSVRLSKPILKMNDSLIGLSKTNFKLASQWLVYFQFILKSPDYEVQVFYNRSWKRIPESEQYMVPEKGMKLVKEGDFAYHTLPEVGYPFASRHFSHREICELTEVHLLKTLLAFTISLNSTFTELARVGLTKIAETGLQYRQVKRWTMRKPECHKNIVNLSGLTMYEFAPHLLILIVGFGLSVVILIFELTKWNFRELNQEYYSCNDK